MKNVWGMSLIIVTIAFVFGLSVFADQPTTHDPVATMRQVDRLIDAMEQTGTKVEDIRLHFGGTYKVVEQQKEARALADRLAARMGLEKKPVASSDYAPSKDAVVFQYESAGRSERQSAALRVIATPNGDRWNVYVTTHLYANANERERLGQRLETAHRALEREHFAPRFNVCARGTINKTLTDELQRKKLDELLALLGAKAIEKAEDRAMKSVSAYTPDFPFYIRTNGEKMNAQAAARADLLRGQTRITVGTPIITIEY